MAKDKSKKLRCSNPNLVVQYDIELYVEGSGRIEFVEHLESCTFCQAEVQYGAKLVKFLSQKLQPNNRPICISIDKLQEYTMNWVKGEEKSLITTHLKGCPFCWMEQMQLQAELDIPLTHTEPFVLLRRVIAFLQPGSQNLQPIRVRGAESDKELIYSFEDVTILLNIEPDQTARNRFTLAGTVTLKTPDPTRFAGSKAILKQHGDEVAQEEIETSGDFFLMLGFPNYEKLKLEIHLSDMIIEIPELPIS